MSESAKFNVVSPNPNRVPSPAQFNADTQAQRDAEAATAMYERELPIDRDLLVIDDAIDHNQAVIVLSEPGSGKTTQMPQSQAARGRRVLASQPRRFVVESVADFIDKQTKHRHGNTRRNMVGFQTGRKKKLHKDNMITLATEGIVANQTGTQAENGYDVLMLDEAHERSWQQAVILAEARLKMDQDRNHKIVLMSGSMNPTRPAEFLSGGGKRNVPIIEVPGLVFPLEEREGTDVVEETIRNAAPNEKVLVFMDGQATIKDVIASLNDAKAAANMPNLTVLPLYSQLSAEDQAKVFLNYPDGAVIVSTDIAESSVTIPGVTKVVDSGRKNQKQYKNGVASMQTVVIPQDRSKQRGGRANRTAPGIYISAPYHPRGNAPVVYLPVAERELTDVPEILRMPLDEPALLLASHGHDMAQMEFLDQPEMSEITTAQERLRNLGALDENNVITDIGREMQKLPIEPRLARMFVEAGKYNDPALQAQAAALVSIISDGNLLKTKRRKRGEAPETEGWRHIVQSRTGNESDLIKQVEIYAFAQVMTDDMEDSDISRKSFNNIRETIKQLRATANLPDGPIAAPNEVQREQLVRCIIAGSIDNIYTYNPGQNGYTNGVGDARMPGNRTLIQPGRTIVASPFDMRINTQQGERTLNFVQDVTNVPSIDVMHQVAPQLFTPVHEGFALDDTGKVVNKISYQFNGMRTETPELVESAQSDERRKYLAEMTGKYAEQQGYGLAIRTELEALQQRTPGRLPNVDAVFISKLVLGKLPIETATVPDAIAVLPPLSIDAIVASNVRAEIYAAAPQSYGGLELEYKDGWPLAKSFSSMRLMRKEDADLRLPDGRDIYATWNGEVQPLVGIKWLLKQSYQKRTRW